MYIVQHLTLHSILVKSILVMLKILIGMHFTLHSILVKSIPMRSLEKERIRRETLHSILVKSIPHPICRATDVGLNFTFHSG